MEAQSKKIPSDWIQKIKEAVNLVEIIGEHVVLRKSGANYVGLCPFHSERSPSFSVSESRQLYHCYGCKRGGDLLTFVQEISGISFAEAMEELSDRAKLKIPAEWRRGSSSEKDQQKRDQYREKQQLAFKLNRFAAAYFHQNLSQNSMALGYLKQRGISAEVQAQFYLGYADPSWEALVGHLQEKKAPLALASELGLIRPSQRQGVGASNSGYYDLFRNRVLFPLVNLRGKVVGFGGRVLSQADTPKYLNSSDSFIFHKGTTAFGLYQAQKYIREKDTVILVEGYFDVLALHAAGIQNAVATCGTALTADHLTLFKRLASRVILLFDGDQAGVSATLRAMELGLEHGWVLHSAQLPTGLDPDELLFDQTTGQPLPEGKAQLNALLEAAEPALDRQIAEQIELGRQGPEAQAQALKQIGSWLARLNDPVGRDLRVELVAQKWRISKNLIWAAMGRKKGESEGARAHTQAQGGGSGVSLVLPKETRVKKNHPNRLSPLDQVILTGLAQGGEWVRAFENAVGDLPEGLQAWEIVESPTIQRWLQKTLSEPGRLNRLSRDVGLELEGEEGEWVRSILTAAFVSEENRVGVEEFRMAVLKRVAHTWAQVSQRIKQQLGQAEAKNDAGMQVKLMKEYLDVQRKMKEFNNFYDEE